MGEARHSQAGDVVSGSYFAAAAITFSVRPRWFHGPAQIRARLFGAGASWQQHQEPPAKTKSRPLRTAFDYP
jgi:hypothetical protein